jgi:hypothetical protein
MWICASRICTELLTSEVCLKLSCGRCDCEVGDFAIPLLPHSGADFVSPMLILSASDFI